MSDAPRRQPLTLGTLLGRARRLRCLACGNAGLFRSWLRMHAHCASCGYRFEREGGYFLGAIYINYGVTGAFLVASVLVHTLIVEVPGAILIPCGVAFGLVFPMWFSRWSRALFMVLDLYYHPPEEQDFVIRTESDEIG